MPELIEAAEKKCPRCAELVKAEARVCRFCQYEFEPSEAASPAVLKKRGGRASIGCLVALALAAALAIFMMGLTEPGSKLASSPLGVDTQEHKITDKLAEDAVKQYNMALSGGGSAIDMCVQAEAVAAAFLQAQDQKQYATWKETEKDDCKRAGVRK